MDQQDLRGDYIPQPRIQGRLALWGDFPRSIAAPEVGAKVRSLHWPADSALGEVNRIKKVRPYAAIDSRTKVISIAHLVDKYQAPLTLASDVCLQSC